MKYKSFTIRNFKGIKNTTVPLQSIAGASVFAFVGLNESGKTTVLEAIHSFSPEKATSELLGEQGIGVPYKERVPRHLLSSFTGDVSVSATVEISDEEKSEIAEELLKDHKLELNVESVPEEVTFERQQRFNNGDFKANYFHLRTTFQVKSEKQRRWREPDAKEAALVRDAMYGRTPEIAYFPTFVFDFPEKAFLTDRGSAVDKFYCSAFQDILDYDGRGYTVERDIVGRVRSEGLVSPWLTFLTAWSDHDSREKIQHVIDRASMQVTKLVFGRWNKIFGEDTKGKELVITWDTVEGEKRNQQGAIVKTHEHDVYIQFKIKDGTRRFNVNDRSLGFRWFFAFMLFTQFRVARAESLPLLFLFDEPASNLHAAAQQRLIDSFPGIAKGEHALAYTTHSHYMIEPKWLEQTFIVTNRADAPPDSMLDDISLDDESLDIKVATYRSFVNEHPEQTTYFQPILDRLEVKPSRFDMQRASIVVEGKSDYYILRYAMRVHRMEDLPLLPGLGAGTFGALAALHVGWNLSFLFLLDGDGQGRAEKERYVKEFGVPSERAATIDGLVADVSVIEDLLDDEAREAIRKELQLSGHPTKAQLRRFFQERLAMDKVEKLSNGFAAKSLTLLTALRSKLN